MDDLGVALFLETPIFDVQGIFLSIDIQQKPLSFDMFFRTSIYIYRYVSKVLFQVHVWMSIGTDQCLQYVCFFT